MRKLLTPPLVGRIIPIDQLGDNILIDTSSIGMSRPLEFCSNPATAREMGIDPSWVIGKGVDRTAIGGQAGRLKGGGL